MFIRSTASAAVIAFGVGLLPAAPSAADGAGSWLLDGGNRISFAGVAAAPRHTRLSANDLPLAIEPMRTFAMAPGVNLVWQAGTTQFDSGHGDGPGNMRPVSAPNGLHTPQLFLRLARKLGRVGTTDIIAKIIAGKFTPVRRPA